MECGKRIVANTVNTKIDSTTNLLGIRQLTRIRMTQIAEAKQQPQPPIISRMAGPHNMEGVIKGRRCKGFPDFTGSIQNDSELRPRSV